MVGMHVIRKRNVYPTEAKASTLTAGKGMECCAYTNPHKKMVEL